MPIVVEMEERHDDVWPYEQGASDTAWWPPDFVDKFGSTSLELQDDILQSKDFPRNFEKDRLSSYAASQALWSTGQLSEPIPNRFYSVIPDKRLKELFDFIPTLDELHALGEEGRKADAIIVDFQKDKKLSMLKQLTVTLVKGLNFNPGAVIKKIAGLVSDVYKRSTHDSPAKTVSDHNAHLFENRSAQLLGQIKQGTCRSRAILFKVLADTIGLECKLVVGLPSDGTVECVDFYKHMSVVVVLNSMELLVDLMRSPGQLLRRSTKAIAMAHMSVTGESDSAENDSCDSPLEPNSPLCGFPERIDPDSAEKDENLQFRRKMEGTSNISGLSLQSASLWATRSFERRLSPEHPSFRQRERSILSGGRSPLRDFSEDATTSRSFGTSTSESRRIRRRSISITPEIGDDIVRAVRAMNEALKQGGHSSDDRKNSPDIQKDMSSVHDQVPGCGNVGFSPHAKDQVNSPKAMSLPSSPHDYRSQSSERSGLSEHAVNDMWNRVLESPMFRNGPLLPFQEWNIDFSELIVGTRVGIGFFGEVFRGMWNGTQVAIKVFLEQDLTAENMEDFCNEISILSRLRHPNVILFLGACTKPPRLSMVTEYMEMGSLYHLIHLSGQKKILSWRRRLKMLRDICRGLMCIHRMKIVHRDLKSANCLVNKHWLVKICDFGLSRILSNVRTRNNTSAGTPEWMAPELIRNESFTEKCDIFSLGVIMWELCTLSKPWEGVPPDKVVSAVANEGSRLEIPQGPLGRLIADCWAEPQSRPSCEEILSRLLDCEYSLC